MNIKVLVATHKEYEMPEDEMYLPIHVGKDNNHSNLGYIGDNTGDNISKKNPNYCELTAIYWAWKNLEADAVGLVHYRRHFSFVKTKDFSSVLSKNDVKRLLLNSDIIVPKKRNYYIESNYSHYIHSHPAEPLDEALKLIKELYPEYQISAEKVMRDTKAHMFNMFIMKKGYFDSYCNFMFTILFELEKRIDISNYNSYEARVFGFISELLLDIWIETNSINYVEVNFVHMENENLFKKGIALLGRKLAYRN